MSLIEIIKSSDSLNILREINSNIGERKFHEFTHILYDIRTYLGNKEKTYLEIGSYVGSSASLMLNHPFKTKVICIDPLCLDKKHYKGTKNQEQTLKDNLSKNNIHSYEIEIHKKLSTDKKLIDEFKFKKLEIDILFIDGDHSREAVFWDWENYEPFIKQGGFIVFDDYLDFNWCPQVHGAVNDIVNKLDTTKYEIIGSIPNFKKAYSMELKKNSNEFIIKKI
jgi:hypothetical protein